MGNGEGRGRCWVDWVVKRRERGGGGVIGWRDLGNGEGKGRCGWVGW